MRFFFFCVHSYISGVHLLLLLRSQLYLWGSPSAFTAISLGFTFFFFCVHSYIYGVHLLILLLLLLRSQLYVWGSPSSSSVFPAISLGFTFSFCVPSYISWVHLLLLLCFQIYLWGSSFFFFYVPSYISGVHLLLLRSQLYLWSSPSSSSSVFPAISLGFTILGEISTYVTYFVCLFCFVLFFNPTMEVDTFRLGRWYMLDVFLLPAFTRLGHECQDLLSPSEGMYVCTDYASGYALIQKSFREWSQNPREKSPLREARTRNASSRRTASPARCHSMHGMRTQRNTVEWNAMRRIKLQRNTTQYNVMQHSRMERHASH